jgi:phage protein D
VTQTQPIYADRDFYVPSCDIRIRDVDISPADRSNITQIRYTDSIDQIDSFELTINNWDPDTHDFRYTGSTVPGSDDDRSTLFEPGQKIELWMGYRSPGNLSASRESASMLLMLVGVITKLTPIFPASGGPTLKVSGQNVLRQFLTEQKTDTYGPGITDSGIARKIDQRRGFILDGTRIKIKTIGEAAAKEPDYDHVLQDNIYDILFLLQRARLNGYDLLLQYPDAESGDEDPYLYFGPSSAKSRITYRIEWGRSLVQFQPTLTTTNQVSEVTVRGWDMSKKKTIEVTVSRDDLEKRSLKDEEKYDRIEQGFRERKEIIVDRPFRNETEAKNYALDRLNRIARDMVTGKGSTVGMPAIRAGSKIELLGLGSTFDGPYFVTSTTHTIGTRGYTTDFEARLEEDNT